MYETVVVSTVVMHFAFIAYVLAGGFLALRWRRTMWLHVPAVIWGIGIAAKRVDCPLTWVERWARTKAAMTPLSPDGFVAHGEVTEPTLFPSHPQWSNYREVFALMPFWRMFFNTVLYAGCVTAGQVFFCSLAGYAFARLQFRGRDTLFVLYLSTLMVPLTVTVIPQFILMRIVGWVDTPWAMIVPGLFGSAFGTYLMRQFFRTLPTDLEEAAILDGCSPWQIYWRILLPHSRPAVLVLGVLTWVNVWNDFLWPLLMIQRNSLATLTLGLVRLRGEYVARWPVLMAASMLMLVPLVILYAVAQRSFVRGIAVTGLGG